MDAKSPLTLRIFVSSPGDVPVERDRAADVIARLQEEFKHYARLEPFFWEDEPVRATDTFQPQLPEASEMDIVVGILWARIGTLLAPDIVRPDGRRYESGTVYELETAAASYRSRAVPDLVVYRKTSNPPLELDDEVKRQQQREQLEALEAFIRQWFFHEDGAFKAAFRTFKTTDQFEHQLETHLRRLIREKIERTEQPGEPTEGEIVFHGDPYPGLKAFSLDDAPVFYGRERALSAVKEGLRAQAARNCAFLLIFGMSGSGKSSLVRAGLLHAMTATPGWIPEVDVWRWCVVRPGDATGDPVDAVAHALFSGAALPELQTGDIDAARLARTLRENPDCVDVILRPALRSVAASERERRAADRPLVARLLVVVDQMEELFTRDWLDVPERARYVRALEALARSGAAYVVATMRSDFFGRCAEIAELVTLKEGQGQFDLAAPTSAEIGQIIRYPARDAALRWGKDPGHPGETLDDLLQQAAWRDPKALPLLQFTLSELFRRRAGRVLAWQDYHALGGLEGALAKHAEDMFVELPPDVQAALPVLLRALVTTGEGDNEPVVSRRVPLEPLRADSKRGRLLDVLTEGRLLVTDRDDRMQAVVGIAHEAMLTHWPRLKDLLDKDREFLRARVRADAAAELWRRKKRHRDFLLREGIPLIEAGELLNNRRDDLERETIKFIEESIRYWEYQRTLRRRRVAAVLAVILAFAAFSFVQWRRALEQQQLARVNAYFAKVNLAQREWEDAHATRALELLEGERPARGAADLRGFEWYYVNRLCHSDLRTFEEHRGSVTAVVISPDGKRIASASLDGTLKIWDAVSGATVLTITGHEGGVNGVAFSPDGMRVASAGVDKIVRIWDALSGQGTFMLRGHADEVSSVAFSPDGIRLAAGSHDRSVTIWNAGSGRKLRTLEGHAGPVSSVAFSPDGTRIASGSYDHAVKLWDVVSGKEKLTIKGHTDGVNGVAFSPDGRRIATAGYDHTVKLWEADTGRETLTLVGHTRDVNAVAFSPDGRRVASASWDQTVRVWDSASGLLGLALRGHTDGVRALAFSPNGTRIASGSHDRTFKVWDAGSDQMSLALKGHNDGVSDVVFGPGDTRIVSASLDHTVKVWDVQTGKVTLTLAGHTDIVNAVAVSRDGTRIASASNDTTARIWDAGSGEEALAPLEGHTGSVNGVAFSPGGNLLATASLDRTVKIWDAASGAELLTLTGHTEGVNGVAFSPDSTRVASAGADNIVKVWDTRSGQGTVTLAGHTASVSSVAFSPDGKRIVSASYDQTIRLWDGGSGRMVLTLKGHTGGVNGVAFSPDGRRIASAGFDATIKVWDATSGQEALRLKGHENDANRVAFSSDGRRLATASNDHTIRIWDARDK